MANWYVNSAATGTGSGTTWVNATVTLAAALALAAAGDQVNVANTHSESTAGGVTLASPGTNTNPVLVISVDTINQPPTAADVLAGASVATTGANGIVLSGSSLYVGLTITAGNNIDAGGVFNGFQNCVLICGTRNAGAADFIELTAATTVATILDNTQLQFTQAANIVTINGGYIEWRRTPNAILGTAPTTLIPSFDATSFTMLWHGVDLTALGASTIAGLGGSGVFRFTMSECKISASTVLKSGLFLQGDSLVLANVDSGATGFRNEWHGWYADTTTETTITLKNGASDGVQSVSHKHITTANPSVKNPYVWPPQEKRFGVWNTTTGKSVTATVQIISSGTLNNNDIWLEIEYLGSSTSPLSSFANNGLTNPLSTPAAQTSSSATWNAQPATPVTQQLQVSFTPQMVGYVYGRIYVGKASATLWVDPEITIK